MDRFTKARLTALHGRDYYSAQARDACPGMDCTPEGEDLWEYMAADLVEARDRTGEPAHDILASMILDGADVAKDPNP